MSELNKESVEQAGGDERAGLRAAAKWHRGQRNAFEAEAEMHRQRYENTNRPDSLTAEAEHHRRLWETASAMAANHLDYAAGFEEMARAALAQPSPASDLDPLNLAPHAKAFNEAPAEALKPGQAEEERPKIVATLFTPNEKVHDDIGFKAFAVAGDCDKDGGEFYDPEKLMTVAQHERITAQLHDALDESDGDRWKLRSERDAANARLHEVATACATAEQERDAALARVAELEKQEPVATVAKVPGEDWNGLHFYRDLQGIPSGTKLYAAAPAQAQHSVPDELRAICMLVAETGIKYGRGRHRAVAADECRAVVNAVLNADLSVGRACEYAGCCDKAHPGTSLCIAHHSKKAREQLLAAAPGKDVPQAWLDVQAERRRQITAEGWTPEHDDEHSHGEIAQAAGCYALHAGGIQNGWALFWPWDEQWWKPTTTRRDLVKACALGLAEIERLDRAAAPGKEVGHE